jgi:hypothetical protein
MLLLINILLLLLGTFMDMAPMILICTPIMLPVVKAMGVDPVHFGMIMLLNLGIGLITPPVGPTLFVGCAIGKVTMEEVSRELWPFYGAMCSALLIVTYVPALRSGCRGRSAIDRPALTVALSQKVRSRRRPCRHWMTAGRAPAERETTMAENAVRTRVAIIGAGMAWAPYRAALNELASRVEVAWVAGRTTARIGAAVRDLPGAQPTTSLEPVLADASVVAAMVLTPPNTHTEVVSRLAAAGKHVLLEKPWTSMASARPVSSRPAAPPASGWA